MSQLSFLYPLLINKTPRESGKNYIRWNPINPRWIDIDSNASVTPTAKDAKHNNNTNTFRN